MKENLICDSCQKAIQKGERFQKTLHGKKICNSCLELMVECPICQKIKEIEKFEFFVGDAGVHYLRVCQTCADAFHRSEMS